MLPVPIINVHSFLPLFGSIYNTISRDQSLSHSLSHSLTMAAAPPLASVSTTAVMDEPLGVVNGDFEWAPDINSQYIAYINHRPVIVVPLRRRFKDPLGLRLLSIGKPCHSCERDHVR